MELLAQYALGGVATGSLYSLVALGIVLLYRSSRILNFAHGDIATFATFVAFTMLTSYRLSFGMATVASLLIAAGLGAAFYLLVLRRAKEATLLGAIVVTLGLSQVLSGAMVLRWGADTKVFPFPLSDSTVYRVGEVVISQLSIGSVIVGLVLMAGLYVLVQHTKLGLAMRAVSQDLVAAQVLGIPAKRVFALTWGLAATLGAAAGILVAPAALLDPFMMLDPFLKGFAAAVLGGIDSLPGAMAGGLLLGIAEALFGAYVSIRFKTTLAFLIILGVLIIRPEGLLGKEYRRRV